MGGIATARDNVIVKNDKDLIYCDRLVYNAKTKTAICKGNVRIYTADRIYRGDTMIYNLVTKAVQSADFRLAHYPSFIAGELVTTPEINHYRIHNGFFSTDNRLDPAFRMHASTIEVYPDEQVVLKNITVYIGDVPVLWLPIYAQSIRTDREGYKWSAGYNGAFGAFFYNRYNWVLDENLFATVLLDVRQKRGVGGGFNLDYDAPNGDKGLFRGYVTQDDLYSSGGSSGIDKYRFSNVNTEKRYRFAVKERFEVAPDLVATASLNKWSDPNITRDFFESEFQREVQPDNFVNLVQYSPNYTISALIRPQVNPFFETVERKPDITWDIPQQKLFDAPISYQGQSSLVAFDRRFAWNTNQIPTFGQQLQSEEYRAYRYDTFHQILYPKQYFNWLSVTPRFGLRGTYWSDDNRNVNDKDSSNSDVLNPRARVVPNIGVESSFKLSHVWDDIKSKQWGIDGLRHVMEPHINAQYIPDIIGARPGDIRGFDTRLPSTRLQPLNFPDYNSIDSIDYQAVVRHGIRNKLQTKRDGRNWDLIDWDLYADYDADRNFSATNQKSYSNLFSDITIRPVNWISFQSQASFDVTGNSYTEFNNDITWEPVRSVKLQVGNRFIQDSVLFPNSNLYYLHLFYRLNEHWQFSSQYTFEASSGRLQEQDYTIYRDLESWQVAANFTEREVNNGINESIIFFTFTLKALPNAQITTSSLK
jgi:LPS-assembly protein